MVAPTEFVLKQSLLQWEKVSAKPTDEVFLNEFHFYSSSTASGPPPSRREAFFMQYCLNATVPYVLFQKIPPRKINSLGAAKFYLLFFVLENIYLI